jgi:hypothetical protein
LLSCTVVQELKIDIYADRCHKIGHPRLASITEEH